MTLHLADTESTGLYNVGTGDAHTWLDLVGPIFDTLGLPAQIEFIDMPLTLRDKYQYSTKASIEKIRETGFSKPLTPLREAVMDYVGNYLIEDRRLDPVCSPAHV